MLSDSQKRFDREHIWHPYTSLTDPLPVYPVKATEGVHLILDDGRKLVDGMSSWWCAIHGYGHPALVNALQEQAEVMSHVMFGGITHEPAIELAQRLIDITPQRISKVFLCDSGSVSVEVAIKMAYQYAAAKGKAARKLMTIRKGYHGDTFGAMAVCDPVGGMHSMYGDVLPQHVFVDEPQTPFGEPLSDKDKQTLETAFKTNARDVAAFILEPIVQGAGGMRKYSAEYLKYLRSLCDAHGVLLIFDEIATGFGRTGMLFAAEHAQVSPDIMCVGKAITGGMMTLAAALCTDEVALTIGESEAGVLMHGPTFMGTPLACKVACASIDLLRSGEWKSRVKSIENQLTAGLKPLLDHAKVKDVRVLGAIGVLECISDICVAEIQKFFVENGVWIRPFRNLIYIMPPYIIKSNQLEKLMKVMSQSLDIESHFKSSSG
jgi:adenosylmethionine-8-amino-7-oxononanoate aminotransferase